MLRLRGGSARPQTTRRVATAGESEVNMPPMSKIRTFVDALKTGETKTTKALQTALGPRQSATARALIAALRQTNALKRPLAEPFRGAIKKGKLHDDYVTYCIDAWPDQDKEDVRKELLKAIGRGDSIRFRWGLKSGAGHEAVVEQVGRTTTIMALSPRSLLKASGDEIYVGPHPPKKRRP